MLRCGATTSDPFGPAAALRLAGGGPARGCVQLLLVFAHHRVAQGPDTSNFDLDRVAVLEVARSGREERSPFGSC